MSDNNEPCMCGTPFTCMADDHEPSGEFLPDPCGYETRSPRDHYAWLECDRPQGHVGEHRDEYSGYRWEGKP